MSNVNLEQALTIAQTTLKKGREMNFHPLTVVVLDAGGHMKALLREDHCSILREDIARGKAWGVLGMGFGGREIARRAEKMPAFISALNVMSEGKMVPVAGGVLIRDANNHIIGSVGVTGDTSDNDELCAVAGIQAAGLTPDTGDK
ncbi:hypothetical protein PSHI8_13200 [Polynucleobacter sp. SHI8]|uniref:GlcG/HbpS family heme-binding protein n=1 Tax=unclassified Polynucleobacter TaxID=2640945 RepID=UPI0024917D14|nr:MULTISPECIES: heme-binding protein [unclassified Polynucleobacter]BDW11238.1 hypothetical protein PSHI2_13200 [Polynucleobacter sp. SHI2]BDW13684.1 hypothetical protein PSHI8_13200 [Polynucleobacter sp. SHI8]